MISDVLKGGPAEGLLQYVSHSCHVFGDHNAVSSTQQRDYKETIELFKLWFTGIYRFTHIRCANVLME